MKLVHLASVTCTVHVQLAPQILLKIIYQSKRLLTGKVPSRRAGKEIGGPQAKWSSRIRLRGRAGRRAWILMLKVARPREGVREGIGRFAPSQTNSLGLWILLSKLFQEEWYQWILLLGKGCYTELWILFKDNGSITAGYQLSEVTTLCVYLHQ